MADDILKAYSVIGVPIILSAKPELKNEDSALTMFLILGSATYLVDFQINCKSNGGNNASKNILVSPDNIEKVVTSYTIYLAGNGRSVSIQTYGSAGVKPDKAIDDAYKELSGIYDSAVGALAESSASWDVEVWRCDSVTEYKYR